MLPLSRQNFDLRRGREERSGKGREERSGKGREEEMKERNLFTRLHPRMSYCIM